MEQSGAFHSLDGEWSGLASGRPSTKIEPASTAALHSVHDPAGTLVRLCHGCSLSRQQRVPQQHGHCHGPHTTRHRGDDRRHVAGVFEAHISNDPTAQMRRWVLRSWGEDRVRGSGRGRRDEERRRVRETWEAESCWGTNETGSLHETRTE